MMLCDVGRNVSVRSVGKRIRRNCNMFAEVQQIGWPAAVAVIAVCGWGAFMVWVIIYYDR